MEHLVNVCHVEVTTEAEVLRPPVVPSEEWMNVLQTVLARRGITQVSHVQLADERIIYALEYFGDGILALSPFTEHIFLAGRSIQVYTSNTGSLLPTVVLLLHHQIEFVQSIVAHAVFLLVKAQRLQQANHCHPTLMLQLFHIVHTFFNARYNYL